MNTTILYQLCDSFTALTGITVTVLQETHVMYQTGILNQNLKLSVPADLSAGVLHTVFLSEDLAVSCFLTEDAQTIIAGPVFTRHMSEEEKHVLLRKLQFTGDSIQIPVLSAARFQDVGNFLFLAVCHVIAKQPPAKASSAVEKTLYVEKEEADWAAYNDAYTGKMCFYIENGDVEGLQFLMADEQPAPYGELSRDRLRHWKNSCFALLLMIRRAAEKSGVDPVTSLHLAEQYSRKMDEAADIATLTAITRIMRTDYCTRVRECLVPDHLSAAVKKALRVIRMHCHERLSITEIASLTGVTSTYLCAIVKKETGETVNTWVQKEKIRKAKQLLRFTDHSLQNIAESLSYSSQSHFQRTFRKFTGMTPLAYRNSR